MIKITNKHGEYTVTGMDCLCLREDGSGWIESMNYEVREKSNFDLRFGDKLSINGLEITEPVKEIKGGIFFLDKKKYV